MKHQIYRIGKLFLTAVILAPGIVSPGFSAAAPGPLQRRLLNILDSGGPVGSWRVDNCEAAPAAGMEPKLGTSAVEIRGTALGPGSKVDVPLFDGELPGCRSISAWVHVKPESNVSKVGFQVRDSKGEWLTYLVDADWTGWKLIEADPSAAGFEQAYVQSGQNGKVDQPVNAVHMVWFAKSGGPTSLIFDELSALSGSRPGESGVRLAPVQGGVYEPGAPLDYRVIVNNFGDMAQEEEIYYTLQTNSGLNDSVPPDIVTGLDHALGCRNTWAVDGREMGDAGMCDGDDMSAAATPWGKDYKEAVVTADLGRIRGLTAMTLAAGDANWIWKMDVSVSEDGKEFVPVDGLQNYDLHKKWGRRSLPWPGRPVRAKFLKMRFHNNGNGSSFIRLPASLMLFDGSSNDTIAVPKTGEIVASGRVSAVVPAKGFAEVALKGAEPLQPGSYLLGLEAVSGEKKEVQWLQYLVRPAGQVDTERTRRFGINSADISAAAEMRRCGFGWVRFDNAKWKMYSAAKDKYAFDGSVAPWHVDQDLIFSAYQKLGMKVLPYVFMPPDWASSAPVDVTENRSGYPPKDPADYGEAVYQLVAREGGAKADPAKLLTSDKKSGMNGINAVELWSEPNLDDPRQGVFVGPISRYFEVMRAGAEGARRADPTLPVTSCGWAGIGLETVGQLYEYKYADGRRPLDFVDVINVHFYSGREEPEICGRDPNAERGDKAGTGGTYPEQIEDLVAWRDRLKPGAEIWLTETGDDVGGPIGRTERYQAAKVPRAVMIALALGVEKVFIYREKGSRPAMHAGSGLLRDDGSVRPVWLTVAAMIRQLQGFSGRALRLPSSDPKVWMYLWEDGRRKVITAWRYEGTSRLGIDLGGAETVDAFGHPLKSDGTAGLTLGEFPIYINVTAPGAAYEKLVRDAVKAAKARLDERGALSAVPALLFEFGPPSGQLGMLKGYGLPRIYTPVSGDTVWDEGRGYGFSGPAMNCEERRWTRDPLERDSCKVNPGNTFRFRLQPGKFLLRVSARGVNGTEGGIKVKSAAGTEQKIAAGKEHVASFAVEGGQVIEVGVPDYGNIYWISAIGGKESN